MTIRFARAFRSAAARLTSTPTTLRNAPRGADHSLSAAQQLGMSARIVLR